MQAKPKILKIFLVALLASLVLGACGGGNTGSTWFNLPSIPVKIGADGSASVFGFNLGPILQPAMLQQFQAANVQKLEVRLGYNGIHIYANGQDLPYIRWDADSLATVQDLVRKMPNLPNADLIANLLPWTRQIGLGVALDLPVAQGAPAVNLSDWKGETTAQKEAAPAAPTIGPLKLDSLAFDKQGAAKLGSVPLSSLAPIKLDPNTLGLLSSLGLDKVAIKTQPNGIDLSINDKPLPSIAYDSAILSHTLQVAGPLLPDPNLANTLKDVLPKLPGAQLDLAVSFTGQPAGETALAAVPVAINPNGTLAVYGVPVSGNPVVPPDVLQKLQAAKVQNLSVDVSQTGIHLGANGQALPSLTWTAESLPILTKVAQQAGGVSPDLINTGMTILKEMGGIKANVAVGGGAAPASAPVTTTATSTATTTVSAKSVSGTASASAILHVNAVVQQGAVQALGGITPAELPVLPLALPPNVSAILTTLGAKQVQIITALNKLDLMLDGKSALTMNYDVPSLQAAMTLATPFLAGTPLQDPNIAKLLKEQILPQVPGSDVNVTVDVK
ncbi:MAG: hypothetical protein U0350_28175 [Caldilineaceae bacterium]